LDAVVNDLHKEWCEHDGKKEQLTTSAVYSPKHISIKEKKREAVELQKQGAATTATERKQQQGQAGGSSSKNATVPWSLDWLSQLPARNIGNVISSNIADRDVVVPKLQDDHVVDGLPKVVPTKKKGAAIKHSVGFMKRVARMPEMDRKQILKFLKKQERLKKAHKAKHHSKEAGNSTSDSSKNSTSSVNKDWENWVLVHGKPRAVVDDVKEIGMTVGLKFNCDTMNSFNLLTKEGRRVWRAAGGGEVVREFMGDGGRDVDGS